MRPHPTSTGEKHEAGASKELYAKLTCCFLCRILSREERKASRRALIGLAAEGGATSAQAPADSAAVSVSPAVKPPRIALKGVSLRVERGALCAVIGRVGSGKSTLIQVRKHFKLSHIHMPQSVDV